MAGRFGNFDTRPTAMLADSSSDRATCSTIWLGDHLPGARGAVHDGPDRSPSAINCSIASLLAASAALTSVIGCLPASTELLETLPVANGSFIRALRPP